jgi:uncharacterized protein (TIGR02246 family)
MKKVLFVLLVSTFISTAYAQTAADKEAVNQVANAAANSWKNHDYKDMSSYTTEEVYFINPAGMLWKGRADVQKSFQQMHNTFFKNTALTEESRDIQFVTPTVAVVTAVSKVGTFYPPDGVDNGHNKSGGDRSLGTMMVVKQKGKWLLAGGQVTDINEELGKTDALNHVKSLK